MQSFKDSQGNTWVIHMTWGLAEKIRLLCERPSSTPERRLTFDFFNMGDQEQVADLIISDPETGRFLLERAERLVNVLYVLCEDQCKERGISDVEFGNMITDSVFYDSYQALLAEAVNFIPDPERREMFRKILILAGGGQNIVLAEMNRALGEKLTALSARASEVVKGRIETEWKKVDRVLSKAGEENSTTSSLNVFR